MHVLPLLRRRRFRPSIATAASTPTCTAATAAAAAAAAAAPVNAVASWRAPPTQRARWFIVLPRMRSRLLASPLRPVPMRFMRCMHAALHPAFSPPPTEVATTAAAAPLPSPLAAAALADSAFTQSTPIPPSLFTALLAATASSTHRAIPRAAPTGGCKRCERLERRSCYHTRRGCASRQGQG